MIDASVVKYDPQNPDPGQLDIRQNVLISVPFQIVKFQAGVFPFGQQDILDEHDLTDLVKVEDKQQIPADLVLLSSSLRFVTMCSPTCSLHFLLTIMMCTFIFSSYFVLANYLTHNPNLFLWGRAHIT